MKTTVLSATLSLLMALSFGAHGAAEAATTLDFWIVWGSVAEFNQIVAPFENTHPGIDVNITVSGQGNALKEQLTVAVVGGAPPDVVLVVSPAADFAMADLFTPLDPYVERSETISAENYPTGLFELFNWNGVQFAVPGVEGGPWTGLVYNSTLFNEMGLGEPPRTLEELLDYHKKLTRYDGDRLTTLGFAPLDAMGDFYFPDIWPALFDVDIYDEDNAELRINTPEMTGVMEYIQSFFESALIADVWAWHQQHGWWSSSIASGRLGMQINGYWTPGQMREATDEYGYTWVPNVRNDRFTTVGSWAMAIPRGADNPDEAFELIEYFATPEATQLLYDHTGFLNINLEGMRELDYSSAPGLAFYIESVVNADRHGVPENIPNITDVRATLKNANWQVARGETTIQEALVNAHQTLNAQLDEMLRAAE